MSQATGAASALPDPTTSSAAAKVVIPLPQNPPGGALGDRALAYVERVRMAKALLDEGLMSKETYVKYLENTIGMNSAGVSVRDGGKFFNKRHKGRMWLNRERPNLLAIETPVRQLLSIR